MFAKKNTSDYDHSNHIGGVMVSALASSVGDRGFEPRSGKTNKCIKRAKRQIVVTRTLHRTLKIGLHEFNKKTGSDTQ
jgi:hypothetical protein